MRILYLSQYFTPEVGATQARAHDAARALAEAGHEVVVVCEFPNHPAGRMPPAYRGRLVEHERLDGFEVIRLWVRTTPVKSFASRMAFYLSYMVGAILAAVLLVRGRVDVVLASSPPLFVGLAGLVASIARRAPLVFEVRDLWPDAAIRLGELSSPRAIGLARRAERACYRRASRVIAVTDAIAAHVARAGVAPARIATVPNGANTDLLRPDAAGGRRLRAELGLEGRFVALYVGLHGLAHDLDSVMEAAAALREDRRLCFLLVGEGPTKPRLIERARSLGLDNVRFEPEVTREGIAAYFSMADVALVPLRRAVLFQEPMPLKMIEAWACACPVLLASEGAASERIASAGAGLCIEPESPEALAGALRALAEDPARLRAVGEGGRRFLRAAGLTRAEQNARVERLLLDVVAERGRARA